MEITYDYYRIFYYVAKYKSFSKAAIILTSNQPNITRVINNLESQLACKLFVRSNKGVFLTPEGEKLYEHVSVAYQHLHSAELELASDRGLKSGMISIATSETALHLLLLPALRKFHQRYPGVRLRISNNSTPQAIRSLSNGLVDFAVATTPLDIQKPLKKTDLFEFREILIGSGKYKFLSHTPHHLSQLTEYPLICLERSTKTYEFYSEFYLKHGLILNPDTEAATTAQMLPMIQYDLGIGFLPELLAREAIRQGEVFRIPLIEEVPARNICLLEDKSRPLGIAANELKQTLCTAARELLN